MRKSSYVLAALAPLAILASLSLPAAAESEGGACASIPATTADGPLDLGAMPATGAQAIRGVGDECDDVPVITRTSADGARAAIRGEDDGYRHEGREDD